MEARAETARDTRTAQASTFSAGGAYMPFSGMCAIRGWRILACRARAIIMGSTTFTILLPHQAPHACRFALIAHIAKGAMYAPPAQK